MGVEILRDPALILFGVAVACLLIAVCVNIVKIVADGIK